MAAKRRKILEKKFPNPVKCEKQMHTRSGPLSPAPGWVLCEDHHVSWLQLDHTLLCAEYSGSQAGGFLIPGVLHVCVAWESRTSQGWFTRVELGFSLPSLAAPSYPLFLESSLCSVSVCWNVGHTQGSSLLSLISTSALTHPDIPEQRFLVISEHGSIISLLDTCALIFYSFQLSLSQV